MKKIRRNVFMLIFLLVIIAANTSILIESNSANYRSPNVVVASNDTNRVYISDYTNKSIEVINSETNEQVTSITLSSVPNAMELSQSGDKLYVATGSSQGKVIIINTVTNDMMTEIEVGHTPSALQLNNNKLFIANRFDGTVQWIELDSNGDYIADTLSQPEYITREPMAMEIAAGHLYVAGHLPRGTSQDQQISSEIVALEPSTLDNIAVIKMANGSTNVKDIGVSPDGQYLYVAHALGRYSVPTTHADRGWLYTNAISEINITTNSLEATMLVDDLKLGAANPWGIVVSNEQIFLTISGTRELMILDRLKLRQKVERVKSGELGQDGFLEGIADITNDLTFLTSFKKRIELGEDGPRGLTLIDDKVFIANYFGGSISIYDTGLEKLSTIQLTTTLEEDLIRSGERLWNDATIGLQQWQSCASCHPDARTDALSWDNMNTGHGTPKQARTMIDSWDRGRVMSTGVRPNAATAVRAGIKHVMFNASFSDASYSSLDAYVESLEPEQSPYLENGSLSETALRGKQIFEGKGGCITCHAGELKGQDILIYENYTQSELMPNGLLVPPLREVWRTAPYLHDGSAETIEQVLTTRNLTGTHGNANQLVGEELNDLVKYVLSIGPMVEVVPTVEVAPMLEVKPMTEEATVSEGDVLTTEADPNEEETPTTEVDPDEEEVPTTEVDPDEEETPTTEVNPDEEEEATTEVDPDEEDVPAAEDDPVDTVVLNKEALVHIVAEGKTLLESRDQYTLKSADELELAILTGDMVVEDDEVTQERVDATVLSIVKAIEELDTVETDQEEDRQDVDGNIED